MRAVAVGEAVSEPDHRGAGAGVLVVGCPVSLRDQVARIGAAAGVGLEWADGVPSRRVWMRAPAVVIGAAACAEVAGLPRRDHVFVVGTEVSESELRAGVSLGALLVAALPGDGAALVSALATAGECPMDEGGSVMVVGGCGGAGATVLAAAIALRAADRSSAALVDCDPWSGGIDLTVGVEHIPGPRWDAVTVGGGRIAADSLRSALPATDGGLLVLASPRDSTWAPVHGQVPSVVASLRTAGTAVVCDVPGDSDEELLRALVEETSLTVLVVPSTLRGVAAASTVLRRLRGMGAEPALVVRTRRGGGLSVGDVARSLGRPLAASFRTVRGFERRIEGRGDLLGAGGGLAAAADRILDALHEGTAP